MGIPAGFVVSRPGVSLPEDLDEAEAVAYDLVVRLTAVVSHRHRNLAERQLARSEAAGLLCDLIALEDSPALATTGAGNRASPSTTGRDSTTELSAGPRPGRNPR